MNIQYVYVVTVSASGEEIGEFWKEEAFLSEQAAVPSCVECMDHYGGRQLFTEAPHADKPSHVCRVWDSPRNSIWLERLRLVNTTSEGS